MAVEAQSEGKTADKIFMARRYPRKQEHADLDDDTGETLGFLDEIGVLSSEKRKAKKMWVHKKKK